MPLGGRGGSTAGNGGSTAGNAGTAGTAMGGDDGMRGDDGTGGESGMSGEGGVGQGGEGGAGRGGAGGAGQGGEGGVPDAMCASEDLDVLLVVASPLKLHDHLPIAEMARTTFVDIVNSGAPLTFRLSVKGSNPHDHTLTFTPQELTTLRNGGTVAMITSSTSGPAGNLHTHTYSIECAP